MNRTLLHDPVGDRWLSFNQPVEIVRADTASQIPSAVAAIESAVEASHLWAAGYVAYEAASGFDAAMRTHAPTTAAPLLWFGLYTRPTVLPSLRRRPLTYSVDEWRPSISREDHQAAIDVIRQHIRDGNTYQVNFTFPLTAHFDGEPEALLHDLLAMQPGGYAALIETDGFAAVSVSPELFFRLDGNRITSRPMKGTRRRGHDPDDDDRLAHELYVSPKDRAENLMVVDMIRNDIGRIAESGSVAVPALFDVERYPTVLQMTSLVTARTCASWGQILAALFPCASITGAPKIRTMDIIAELEEEERGVYTGAIGYLAPGRVSQFSVAIRTVQIDRIAGIARYDVGGGIVWDSVAADEYDECRAKAAVLLGDQPDFELLETMRYIPGYGIHLRQRHLARLTRSARFFGFPLDLTTLDERLDKFTALEMHMLRLRIDRRGEIILEATPMSGANRAPVRLVVSPDPVDTTNKFLYHKTTNRTMYEEVLRRHAAAGVDDVVLTTTDGHVTETCRANVAIRNKAGQLVTPPRTAGLLAGVLREELVARGRLREQPITRTELETADEVYVLSSLRGLRKAELTRLPG